METKQGGHPLDAGGDGRRRVEGRLRDGWRAVQPGPAAILAVALAVALAAALAVVPSGAGAEEGADLVNHGVAPTRAVFRAMPEMEADSEGEPPREQHLVRTHPGPNRLDPPPGRDTVRIVRIKYDEDSGALYFEPSRIEIRSGDTVVWVMEDDINEHDVVSYPDGIPVNAEPFQSPMLRARGQTWEYSLTTPGTYRYHCHPHEEAGMRGQIIVDRPSRPEEIRAPMTGGMPSHNTARP